MNKFFKKDTFLDKGGEKLDKKGRISLEPNVTN